jgi:hypothetical protein
MAEYFVHPNGNDSTGTANDIQQPYKTIQAVVLNTLYPGDIISLVYDPSYPVHEQTGTISINDSGTPENPIIIRSVNTSGVEDGSRSVLEVDTSGYSSFAGTGVCVWVRGLDIANWANHLFDTIRQWRIERVRQIKRLSGGSDPYGRYFLYYCRNCFSIDCQQLVSRDSFILAPNTCNGNILIRCYSRYGFIILGERQSVQFLYCIADSVDGIGFDVRFADYDTVGGSLYGCIALDCTTGFRFRYGGVLASRCVALNSTGNGIELGESSAGGGVVALTDSIIAGSGGYGLERTHTTTQMLMEQRNYWYNNTSGHIKDGTVDASSFADVDPKLSATTLQLASDSPARRRLMEILADTNTYETYIDAGALFGQDVGGAAGGVSLSRVFGGL